MLRPVLARILLPLAALGLLGGCKSSADQAGKSDDAPATVEQTFTLGGYSTPREAYGKAILPAFIASFRQPGKREAKISESYLASGAQARAIVGGFEADIAALSLEPDIEKIKNAGLITRDWKAGEHRGTVTSSIVVIGVRPGNPKKITSWEDLAKPGVSVLTPNVRTSGGAMWNVLALYGALLRGHAGAPAGDEKAALETLAKVLRNVRVMDSSGRDSVLNFERGVGDAIITYENEILVSKVEGKAHEYVTPSSTILIENPVAIVDKNVLKHKNSEVVEAFVQFLYTPEAQRSFAKYGLRPVVASVAAEFESTFAKVGDLFTVRDLGDWPAVSKKIFAPGGVYDQALQLSQEKK
jgi:sulfate/thiosulfate transport system substrate-binding protein